jgi:hypothetical protein
MATWCWKKDLRKDDNDATAWAPYDIDVSNKIETAYQKSQKTTKLDDTYKINFTLMIQHRIDDENRQRAIKRVFEAEIKEEEAPKKRKAEYVQWIVWIMITGYNVAIESPIQSSLSSTNYS